MLALIRLPQPHSPGVASYQSGYADSAARAMRMFRGSPTAGPDSATVPNRVGGFAEGAWWGVPSQFGPVWSDSEGQGDFGALRDIASEDKAR